MEEKWVDEKQVSAITGRALPSLRNDRSLGRGLAYYKVGNGKRSVRYKLSEVISAQEACRVEPRQAGAK